MRSIDDRNRNNGESKTGPDEILSLKGTLEYAELSPYQEPEIPHANTVSIEFINNLKRNYDALEREFLFTLNTKHTEQQENTTKKPFFTRLKEKILGMYQGDRNLSSLDKEINTKLKNLERVYNEFLQFTTEGETYSPASFFLSQNDTEIICIQTFTVPQKKDPELLGIVFTPDYQPPCFNKVLKIKTKEPKAPPNLEILREMLSALNLSKV